MTTFTNELARVHGGRVEHVLADAVTTKCGLSARLMHRYPRPTQANSADRVVRPTCKDCQR